MKTCSECARAAKHLRRSMCGACYMRWRRANPELVAPRRDPIELFWAKVDRTNGPDSCWEWTGCLDHAGYGKSNRIAAVGSTQKSHRVAYTLLVGSIPAGMELDHLCRNPACANPGHLEPVTHAENHRRRYEAKTHCVRGHEYNPEDTYYRANGYRQCRICSRESRIRKREAAR